MSNKKTLKDFGLPTGFTLSHKNKSKIVKAAIKYHFSAEATRIQNEDIYLLKAVYNALFPKEKLNMYEEMFRALHTLFTDEPTEDAMYTITDHLQLYMGKDSKQTLGMQQHTWGNKTYSQNSNECSENIRPEECELRIPSLGDYKYYKVPSEFLQRITELVEIGGSFNKKIKKFKEEIYGVLNSYSSTITLCEDFKEFIDWIKLANNLPLDTKCTNIPNADKMATIHKLIG